MNRERLTILRDHLVSLPPEDFNMEFWECGTAACIGGWTERLFPDAGRAHHALDLSHAQSGALFYLEKDGEWCPPDNRFWAATPAMAASAIQSMLDSPADDALPVWSETVEAGA